MNEIERRFGWRLRKVNELMEEENYESAFSEYSNLVRLFSRLNGYEDNEKIDFYKKIKLIGNEILFKLFKRKILEGVKEEEFSVSKFKKKLKGLFKENLGEEICNLIKEEKFEKALKKYENR